MAGWSLAAPEPVLGLAAALGAGLLIGLERERRKRQRPPNEARQAAGIRSFALAALGGGVAQALQQPLLVALGALAVLALAALAYWQALRQPVPPGAPPLDVGLTTELALVVTYLVGVLAVQQPALGAGVGAVVAALLAARERLHRFATGVLTDAEWHDALLLAALTLVALPLAPAQPLPWLAGLSPRGLLGLMLLLAVQAAGHVALRLLGARAGLALAGGLGGFVSSTATIAAMGARARATPADAALCAAGATFSTTATWLQAVLMLAVLAPAAATAFAPVALAGALASLACGAAGLRGASAGGHEGSEAKRAPLRPREAFVTTLLLAAVAGAVAWAREAFGTVGALAGVALAALGEAHAPVAALGAMHAAGQADAALVRDGTLLAICANSLTRGVVAFVSGGPRFGARVAGSLALAAAATGAAALLLR